MRLVIEPGVVLGWLEAEQPLPEQHLFLAPTLLRSEVLDSLYRSTRVDQLTDEFTDEVARRRLADFATMKVRYLGDKMLRRRAWDVAAAYGWESTRLAEYVALTQLQADAFVTDNADLARMVDGVVGVVSTDQLN